MSGHTRGPWKSITSGLWEEVVCEDGYSPFWIGRNADELRGNARLIAAAPTQHKEMMRFLPIIERAEADPELWAQLTEGTGIATANGYRAAIAKATQP